MSSPDEPTWTVYSENGHITTEQALRDPAPAQLSCPGCMRTLDAVEMAAIREAGWRNDWSFACTPCSWTGALKAETIGELLSLFGCRTVSDLGLELGQRQETDDDTFIDFIEDDQAYVFGYACRGVLLPFPIDPVEIMEHIAEFDEAFLTEMAEAAENDDNEN